jgi:hypothetical protein
LWDGGDNDKLRSTAMGEVRVRFVECLSLDRGTGFGRVLRTRRCDHGFASSRSLGCRTVSLKEAFERFEGACHADSALYGPPNGDG